MPLSQIFIGIYAAIILSELQIQSSVATYIFDGVY